MHVKGLKHILNLMVCERAVLNTYLVVFNNVNKLFSLCKGNFFPLISFYIYCFNVAFYFFFVVLTELGYLLFLHFFLIEGIFKVFEQTRTKI